MLNKTIFCFLVYSVQHAYGVTSSIPKHLTDCYKNNFTVTLPRPPVSVQVFVELVRKIEFVSGYSTNIRKLSEALLHT